MFNSYENLIQCQEKKIAGEKYWMKKKQNNGI